MALTARNRATLEAAARVLIPSGGTIPIGADDLQLVDRIFADAAGWPPRVQRQIRLMLTAFEWLPIRRRFSRMSPDAQQAFVEATYHHRSPLRRMLVTLMKQLCYTAFLSTTEVEDAVGYRYECRVPRAGIEAGGGV